MLSVIVRSQRPRTPPSPYRRKTSLFSKDERRFYDALRVATADGYLIFAQVRLIDLVELPRGAAGSPYWYGKVRHKHVDFVLCDPTTAAPRIVIELDGASHASDIQKKRDLEKDTILAEAGLPLLRVATQKGAYNPRQIAAEIDSRIRGRPAR